MRKLFLIFSLLAIVAGCADKADSPCTKQVSTDKISAIDQTQLQKDISAIDTYLSSKSIVAIKDPSGLRYVISVVGDDARPCLESEVTVKYSGKFFNGTVFDSSISAVVFPLNKLILGWQIGFTNFGKGTKATLYIPSGFGYGKSASGTIPANSNLIFDIELISF